MQNLNYLETEHLDILFRGKNKDYGAYALRKEYPVRMRQAIAITTLSILLFYGVQYVIHKDVDPITDVPEYVGEKMKLLEDVILVSTKPAVAAPILENAAPKTAPPVIVETKAVPKPVEKDVKPQDPGPIAVNKTGVPTTSDPRTAGHGGVGKSTTAIDPGGNPNNAGPATTTKAVVPIPDPTPVDYAEVKPEFPGGEDAMLEYLRDRIKYPKMAAENELQGLVYVQFIVNTKGKISDVKVLKGLGMGCDREATRVIKSMPIWSPASNGGNKVNYSFVLPIEFEL